MLRERSLRRDEKPKQLCWILRSFARALLVQSTTDRLVVLRLVATDYYSSSILIAGARDSKSEPMCDIN